MPTKLQQGCILESVYFDCLEGELPAVVLSPACDLEHDKADFATCIGLIAFQGQLEKFKLGSWRDVGTKKALEKKVKNLVGGGYPRHHWFDKVADAYGPWVADFQLITSVAKQNFDELTIIAALDSKFMEQLPARWASYASRIGTPDRPQDSLEELLAHAQELYFPAELPTVSK